MIRRRQRQVIARASGVILSAVVGVGLVASPAYADTSQATANAALVKLSSSDLLSTGIRTASNDGHTTTFTGSELPSLNLLDTQTTLGVGALPQQAKATNDGVSTACAGAVGKGGLIQIGPKGSCTFEPGGATATPGVDINLPGLLIVKADAILEEAGATSDGTTDAHASLVNAKISLLGTDLPAVSGLPIIGGLLTKVLPTDPAPNTKVLDLPGIVTIVANEQTPNASGPGSIKAIALAVHVLDTSKLPLLGGGKLPGTSMGRALLSSGPLVDANIGVVTAGTNAQTAPVPVVPLAGIPIAAALVGFVAYRAWWVPRRRQRAIPAA
jgi:hypothetical protein